MSGTITLPVWLFVLILAFAVVTFGSHFLFPSVRWFFRRRAERLVAELNKRLDHPIHPFRLARRADMIQRLSFDPEVAVTIAALAKETGTREDVLFEEARRYAREIVPGFSATAYFGFAVRAARWLSRLLYTVRLDDQDREDLRTIDPDATVIYVMNHRSNMDYVLVTYLVARHSALSYAVGEWARIWPLRPLIRALGGYFIRRRSRNALYRKVLARYVQLATQGGVTQAMFPEGGLSQSGALMPPKLGLLSYIVEGFDPEAEGDVVFVPVGLNYDRVLEDRILTEALARGQKRYRGTILTATAFVLRYLRRRLSGAVGRFGNAAVSLGRPISLRDWGPTADVEALADHLMARISEIIPVLPIPLVAAVLERANGAPLEIDTLKDDCRKLVAHLGETGAVLRLDGDLDTWVDSSVDVLERRKIVTVDGTGVAIAADALSLISFYAATVPSAPADKMPSGRALETEET